jgi:hypothetical protein
MNRPPSVSCFVISLPFFVSSAQSCCLVIYSTWGRTLMICPHFLPRIILLGWRSMEARMEPHELVSLEPLLFFLTFLLENSIHLLSMCRLVPRAPRSTSKKARADDTFASVSTTKKPHPPSTHSGTQAIDSMLLGECINVLYFPLLFVCFLTRVLFSLQMVV